MTLNLSLLTYATDDIIIIEPQTSGIGFTSGITQNQLTNSRKDKKHSSGILIRPALCFLYDMKVKNIKKLLIVSGVVVSVLILFILGVMCVAARWLPYFETIDTSTSPNKTYEVVVYASDTLLSPDYLVCEVEKKDVDGEPLRRPLYFAQKESQANIEWVSEETVRINGHELNVTSDTYNWGKEADSIFGNYVQYSCYRDMDTVEECSKELVNGKERITFIHEGKKYVELSLENLHTSLKIESEIDDDDLNGMIPECNVMYRWGMYSLNPDLGDEPYCGEYTIFPIPSKACKTLYTDGGICFCEAKELKDAERYYKDPDHYEGFYLESEADLASGGGLIVNDQKNLISHLRRLPVFQGTYDMEYLPDLDSYLIEGRSKDGSFGICVELYKNGEHWYVDANDEGYLELSEEEAQYYERLIDDAVRKN